jgi:radical SAM superfamily enzyme YgiQ (UPF0313 family)
MCDILICSLPVSTMNHAPAAPALLKACVESAGYTAKTLDLSQLFYSKISNNNFEQYVKDSIYLLPNNDYDATSKEKINQWLIESISTIKKIKPKYIGLSIFSYYMQRSAYMLAIEIRKELPTVKIILGGFGLTQPATSLKNLSQFKNSELFKPFNQFMTEQNLCDHIIIGEGEDALVNLLDNASVEEKESIDYTNLYNVPLSNFDDYDLENYNYVDNILLPITGSKGCVRQCTFCDIPKKFGKFRYRSGEHIANEMIYFSKKYRIKSFTFTDSLINGSLKALTDLVTKLAEYNRNNPNEKIKWSAQYISRPENQTPEYLYSLMAESGAEGLTIGLESGSNNVLEAMNKKVKIEDVNAELELFEKYKISTVLLFIIGFYNETYEDFLETLNTIIRYQKYVASGTIIRMELGHPLGITAETSLHDNATSLGITLDPIDPNLWSNKNNLELTYHERIRRRIVAQILCDKLGIPTGLTAYNLGAILNSLND